MRVCWEGPGQRQRRLLPRGNLRRINLRCLERKTRYAIPVLILQEHFQLMWPVKLGGMREYAKRELHPKRRRIRGPRNMRNATAEDVEQTIPHGSRVA
jgi:hypothetical protein